IRLHVRTPVRTAHPRALAGHHRRPASPGSRHAREHPAARARARRHPLAAFDQRTDRRPDAGHRARSPRTRPVGPVDDHLHHPRRNYRSTLALGNARRSDPRYRRGASRMGMIEFEDVSFTYRTGSDDDPALDGVSFEIERGSFVGISGPTDAGKSTTSRAMAGYVPQFFDGTFSGSVTVDGQETTDTTIGELSDQVGMLFEDPFDQLTGSSTTVFEE